MGMSIRVLLLACCAGCIFAQSERETEPAAVLELGGAASRDLKEGRWSSGPSVAVEITPSEKWLSIEMGVTPFRTGHSTEWDTDVAFRKPGEGTREVDGDRCGASVWDSEGPQGPVGNEAIRDAPRSGSRAGESLGGFDNALA